MKTNEEIDKELDAIRGRIYQQGIDPIGVSEARAAGRLPPRPTKPLPPDHPEFVPAKKPEPELFQSMENRARQLATQLGIELDVANEPGGRFAGPPSSDAPNARMILLACSQTATEPITKEECAKLRDIETRIAAIYKRLQEFVPNSENIHRRMEADEARAVKEPDHLPCNTREEIIESMTRKRHALDAQMRVIAAESDEILRRVGERLGQP